MKIVSSSIHKDKSNYFYVLLSPPIFCSTKQKNARSDALKFYVLIKINFLFILLSFLLKQMFNGSLYAFKKSIWEFKASVSFFVYWFIQSIVKETTVRNIWSRIVSSFYLVFSITRQTTLTWLRISQKVTFYLLKLCALNWLCFFSNLRTLNSTGHVE